MIADGPARLHQSRRRRQLHYSFACAAGRYFNRNPPAGLKKTLAGPMTRIVVDRIHESDSQLNPFAAMRPEIRAAVVFSSLVIIAIIVASVSIRGVRTLQRFSERVIEVDGPALAASRGVEARILAAELYLHRAYDTDNALARRTHYGTYAREVATALVDLERIQNGQVENTLAGPLISDFRAAQRRWSTSARNLMVELEQGAPENVVRDHWESLEASFVAVRSSATRIAVSGLEPVVLEHQHQVAAVAGTAVATILVTLVIGVAVGLLVILTSITVIRAQRKKQESDNSYRDFDRRVQRAYQLIEAESEILELTGEVLGEAIDDQRNAELILADASRTKMKRIKGAGSTPQWQGCPVPTLAECPTVQSNSRMAFRSNASFDACRHFRDESKEQPCSAACVPVSVMGRTVGVIHVVGPEQDLPDSVVMRKLESVSRKTGDRVGLARALLSKDEAANTDMLTGLSNRRALEMALPAIKAEYGAYAVAYGDLDHFKRLNDDHGHDMGDRALRLFAQVLRNSLRPSDLICRWGGEEFVIVFPGSGAQSSATALERVRTRLRDLVKVSPVPEFTTSFGVSDSTMAESFEDILHRADAALMSAKKAGRDRYVIDDAAHSILEPHAVDEQLGEQSAG
jgi:diguanylate cyclase (GGDEF)-like protein